MTDPIRRRGLDLLPAHAWEAANAQALAGKTLFISGATGFVGRWTLAAIDRVNVSLDPPLQVRALTRGDRPVSAPWLTWIAGDVCDFVDPVRADLILHAALSSTATPPAREQALIETAVQGMSAIARHARASGDCRSVVLSSGAVYGPACDVLSESSPFGRLLPNDAYAQAKRDVEVRARQLEGNGREVVIARLFTCIGYGYRAHGHLAHVSMIDDARAGRPIVLRSDGSAIRSYLFGADLAIWLLALVSARGSDTVNVGSDQSISMLDFARLVSRTAGFGNDSVAVRGTDRIVRPYFVPDISHARARYRVAPWTSVATAVTDALAGRGD